MKHLLKIVNQDIETLKSLMDHLSNNESYAGFEIELALRKVNDIYNELLMMKKSDHVNWVDLNNSTREAHQNTIDSTVSELKANKSDVSETIDKIPEEVLMPLNEELVESETPELEEQEVVDDEGIEEMIPEQSEVAYVEPEVEVDLLTPIVEANEFIEEHIIEEEVDDEVISMESVLEQIAVDEPEKKAVAEKPLKATKEAKEVSDNIKSTVADRFQHNSPSLNDIQSGVSRTKDLASKFSDRPITKLSNNIKINDRVWYINELFNRDSELYSQTISALDKMQNLDEALSYLFGKFQWDQEKKSTINFLELVFRRFAI